MEMSQRKVAKVFRILVAERWFIVCLMLALCGVAQAQKDKSAPAKTALTGRYEGTAKNKADEVITVAFDLTEKEGALSGTINSSHGDFPITGGSHQGENVTIEFDAGGPGTISMRITDDRLVGTWTAGDDGGPVDVKRVAAQPGGAKDKS
jgi:hypothetical protein